MSHIVETKTENNLKVYIVKFHKNLRQTNSLELLGFFFFVQYISIYNQIMIKVLSLLFQLTNILTVGTDREVGTTKIYTINMTK